MRKKGKGKGKGKEGGGKRNGGKIKNRHPGETAIELHSTPYTLTSPLYRHGSIRLYVSRSKKSNGRNTTGFKSSQAALARKGGAREAELDWTAYQMAISGGTGDYYMAGHIPSVSDLEDDEGELEEIEAWFEGFGFGPRGLGDMIKEKRSRRKERPRWLDLSRDVRGAEEANKGQGSGSRENEVEYAGNGGESHRASISMSLSDLPPLPRSGEAAETIPEVESLPPSPLPEFDLNGEMSVPMGFNLGHDLDDYLRWEREQAVGGSPVGI
jgi:hypothetical protein